MQYAWRYSERNLDPLSFMCRLYDPPLAFPAEMAWTRAARVQEASVTDATDIRSTPNLNSAADRKTEFRRVLAHAVVFIIWLVEVKLHAMPSYR